MEMNINLILCFEKRDRNSNIFLYHQDKKQSNIIEIEIIIKIINKITMNKTLSSLPDI